MCGAAEKQFLAFRYKVGDNKSSKLTIFMNAPRSFNGDIFYDDIIATRQLTKCTTTPAISFNWFYTSESNIFSLVSLSSLHIII